MIEKRSATQGRPATHADWGDLHHRLHAAAAALEQGWALSPEEKKKILKTRAQALACEPEPHRASEAHMDVVEFLLAYERYGIKSSYVREVYPLRELTPMLCAPPFVLGIINLRGEILSVIDLKSFFDLPQKGLTDLNKVLVVRTDGMELGILADVILGVRTISLLDLQSSLPTLTGIRAEYLQGVTEDRLVVLDAEKILSDKKIIVHAGGNR
jgi:purine-binding chemotaxis protein CheW